MLDSVAASRDLLRPTLRVRRVQRREPHGDLRHRLQQLHHLDVSRSYLNVNAPQGMFSCGFMFTVPTGVNSVTFTTSGGTGNGDLYVWKLDWPRLDTYDRKSAGY